MTDTELAGLEAQEKTLWLKVQEADQLRSLETNKWSAVHNAINHEQKRREILAELAIEGLVAWKTSDGKWESRN
jgi:hypothetical protein